MLRADPVRHAAILEREERRRIAVALAEDAGIQSGASLTPARSRRKERAESSEWKRRTGSGAWPPLRYRTRTLTWFEYAETCAPLNAWTR